MIFRHIAWFDINAFGRLTDSRINAVHTGCLVQIVEVEMDGNEWRNIMRKMLDTSRFIITIKLFPNCPCSRKVRVKEGLRFDC